jgi:hypothetical protein
MIDQAFWNAFARRHPIEPQVDDDYLDEPLPGFEEIDDSAPDFYYLNEE